MPNNVYMYFHLTASPSEPMSVQLQTLQMHSKMIYMILCKVKVFGFKKRESTEVQFCFCVAAFMRLGTAALIGVNYLWDLMPYSLVTFVFAPFYRSPFNV